MTRVDYSCTMYNRLKCKGRAVISNMNLGPPIVKIRGDHNHLPQMKELPKVGTTLAKSLKTEELTEAETTSGSVVAKEAKSKGKSVWTYQVKPN